MANRILRDCTDSEAVNNLSFQAEVLFYRLMMKADDYGCFHAHPKLVKAALFPLKDLREPDITRWLQECQESGLIVIYESNGKKYLEIINFGQRLRAMNRKFPENKGVENNDSNARSDVSSSPPETKRSRNEIETENEVETNNKIPTENEFLEHCKAVCQSKYASLEFSLKSKYQTWVDDGWKTGHNKPIKNWKNTINNTIPFLKPITDGKQSNTDAIRNW